MNARGRGTVHGLLGVETCRGLSGESADAGWSEFALSGVPSRGRRSVGGEANRDYVDGVNAARREESRPNMGSSSGSARTVAGRSRGRGVTLGRARSGAGTGLRT